MTSFCKSILKNCVYHGKKSILKNWLIFAKKELLIVFFFWNVIVFRCLKEIYIWKKMKIIFSKIFACSTAIEPAGWELSIKNHFVNPENPRGQIKRGSTWQDFFLQYSISTLSFVQTALHVPTSSLPCWSRPLLPPPPADEIRLLFAGRVGLAEAPRLGWNPLAPPRSRRKNLLSIPASF